MSLTNYTFGSVIQVIQVIDILQVIDSGCIFQYIPPLGSVRIQYFPDNDDNVQLHTKGRKKKNGNQVKNIVWREYCKNIVWRESQECASSVPAREGKDRLLQ